LRVNLFQRVWLYVFNFSHKLVLSEPSREPEAYRT
jgi:hypothetical protein